LCQHRPAIPASLPHVLRRARMIKSTSPSRLIAIVEAFLVVTLWSSSWVMIKWGLEDIPPLTFGGLRYFVAFLVLLPFALSRDNRVALSRLSRRSWLLLSSLGLLFYAIGAGGQFVALSILPTVTTRLLFALSTVVVGLLSGLLLRERPAIWQWLGILAAMTGIYVYFHPVDVNVSQLAGILAALTGMLAMAGAAIVGRAVARSRVASPLVVSAVSMGVGSVVLLLCGVLLQGLPAVSLRNWLIIGWMSVINTAFAFVLWNHSLRTLTAVESNIITNVMIVEIAVLAWLFLGERLTYLDTIGLALVMGGTLLVQVSGRKAPGPDLEVPA
jgi:drug/metabolite transporter (DMT)-like permease